jgi:hypothetical protein
MDSDQHSQPSTHAEPALGPLSCSALPCPHCGSAAQKRRYHGDPSRIFYGCSRTECGHTYAETDEVNAIAAWNNRWSAWMTTKQVTPEEGEWVLHTYAGVRAPEYGLYARGRFWRNNGPESFPTTHWLRIPDIEPNASDQATASARRC